MHFLSLFFSLNEGILKIPGIKYKINGYNNDNAQLDNESFIKCI